MKLTDGEKLQCIGGPMDGDTREVIVLKGATAAMSSFWVRGERGVYRYKLDEKRRAWVFDVAAKDAKAPELGGGAA